MKVLVISHAYVAPINREKIKALARRPDLEISLFLPTIWREGNREYQTDAGEVDGYRIYTGNVLFPGRVTGHVYRDGLIRVLKDFRPDVIHLEQEPWSCVTAQVIVASFLIHQRPRLVIFSFENLDLNLSWYYRAIEQLSLSRADIFIAAGTTSRDRFIRRGVDSKRLFVLPQFGLDPDFFCPPQSQSSPKIFTVGYVGRLVPEKGVDIFIRALAGLRGEWHAIIIGDGPNRRGLESLAWSLGISDRIEFRGWVDHQEVPEYMKRMSVLVLPALTTPTWSEQFGHVLIEAMSCGVVPIGSNSGEIPEVIRTEGLVFPEGDQKALLEVICRLRDEKGLREGLAIAGRERVISDYNWERIAEETHAIYQNSVALKKEN